MSTRAANRARAAREQNALLNPGGLEAGAAAAAATTTAAVAGPASQLGQTAGTEAIVSSTIACAEWSDRPPANCRELAARARSSTSAADGDSSAIVGG